MRNAGTAQHLSDAQKNEVLLGGDAGPFGEHLQACESCRAEIAAMQTLLGCFGESVVQQGAALQDQLQQERLARRAAMADTGTWRERLRSVRMAAFLKPSLAIAMLLAFATVFHLATKPGRSHVAGTVSNRDYAYTAAGRGGGDVSPGRSVMQPNSDDLLMDQVAEQLDQNVPASMLPLTAMVTSEAPHATGVEKEN